jgi:xylan 1,4-beta-xylosidase
MIARNGRLALIFATLAFTALPVIAQEMSEDTRAARASADRLPRADLGNGYFRNPVLRGPGADNHVIKVGQDYYQIDGGGFPDQIIWHSRDLVNWRPLTRALSDTAGRAWASDLAYHNGKFYLYTTLMDPAKGNVGPLNVAQRSLLGTPERSKQDRAWDNIVLVADRPEGPWSKPIHLGIYGFFDPGHVVDQQGNRYLYFNKGYMIRLAPDGLSTVGEMKKIYDGWDYPDDWAVECKCLEAPKFAFHDGWYYMTSAEGGTGGPATAHLAIVARSRSVEGPWENSPYNPLIHTGNQDFAWSRQGHGTLIPDAAGKWWVQYTGYEKGAEYFGKQLLMLPIEWTADGWPRVPVEADATKTFPMPAGSSVGHGMPLSDDFTASGFGIQWEHAMAADPSRFARVGGGALRMEAAGLLPGDAAVAPAKANMLSIRPQNRAFEVEVEIEAPPGAEAGMLLDDGRAGQDGWANVGLRNRQTIATWSGVANYLPFEGNRIFVRLRNARSIVTAFYSADGKTWRQFPNATAVAQGRRLSLYASGAGEVTFKNFIYRGLD